MIIIMMGPPGAGKGTQTQLLSKRKNIPALVMGDVLRKEIKEETELGKVIRSYVEKGELVPDRFIVEITKKFLNGKKDAILDGFPRNINQAQALRDIRQDLKVVYIELSDEEIVNRISARRVCEKCGAVYNLYTNPPKKEGICDKCGGRLIQRADDREEVIKRRIEIYKKETKPLIDYFEQYGCLVRVNGNASIEEVYSNIEKAVWE